MRKSLYIKYSNERSRKFAVKTEILSDDDGRIVRKSALYPEGKAHIKNLLRWYDALSKSCQAAGFEVNRCSQEKNAVLLEYLQGQTLEELLDEKILAGDVQDAEQLLMQYLQKLHALHTEQPFVLTEAFFGVFGRDSGIETLTEQNDFLCGAVTDIDLVCANIIQGEKQIILDYEWTFDFPIPCSFLLYRVLHYYLDTHPMRKALSKEAFFESFSITPHMMHVFSKMEEAFQFYIAGECVPVRELYSSISPGVRASSTKESKLQIYFGIDGEITEQNSISFPIIDGKAAYTVLIPKDCRFLRIDPCDKPCMVHFLKLAFDDKNVCLEGQPLNQARLSGEWGYFADDDPAVTAIKVPEHAKALHISIQIFDMEREVLQQMLLELGEKERLEEKVQRQAEKIYEIKNTKIWKLYQSYRNVVERKKK